MDNSAGYPERGARRRKLAGYLKSANELRQSYQQQYGLSRQNDGVNDDGDSMPGSYPDVSVVRSGDEEMLLFPSYARRHRHRKAPSPEMPGASDDLREAQNPGDAEYWKREWDKYEERNAVVDVDIRGWVYNPQRGQMTRKNRLLVGIARQLSGIPAPSNSRSNSRAASPHSSLGGKLDSQQAKQEEEMVEREAQSIRRRGHGEADMALRGGYSEAPSEGFDQLSLHSSPSPSRSVSPQRRISPNGGVARPVSTASLSDEQSIKSGLSKRASWNHPAQMSQEELAMANANLMLRLSPFLTTPLVQTPLTVFFYNNDTSKSRTVATNEAGHFQLRMPLDFVPTHVRVLASDKLSATEEVRVTEPTGVSLISDIDDTIKHSGIGAGAREIFRNAFVRDLTDLTIDGVREWYSRMSSLGVKLHYVSNAPWQLYPVLVDFFAKAGLPKGSFHLKQYTGMLQGIFEPVAERKKGTLERIMTDFPERQFILVGDSGEADLELYTDLLLTYPGRILGVFIRDVTSVRPQLSSGEGSHPSIPRTRSPFRGRHENSDTSSTRRVLSRSSTSDAAPPPLPPRIERQAVASSLTAVTEQGGPRMGTLIDFGIDVPPAIEERRSVTDGEAAPAHSELSEAFTKSSRPPLPSKPPGLRASNVEQSPKPAPASISRKPAPPPPPKARQANSDNPDSTAPIEPSPLSQTQTLSTSDSRSTSTERPSYRTALRRGVTSAYNSLPSFYGPTSQPASDVTSDPRGRTPAPSTNSNNNNRQPPPIPPRRTISSQFSTLSSSPTNISDNRNPNSSAINSVSGGTNSAAASYSTSNNYPPYDPTITKKEELWLRRWQRAKEIFEDKGVVLKLWRVGGDAEAQCVRVVERALRDIDRHNGMGKG